jgi:hypothetical protein
MLVANTSGVGASASEHHQRPVHARTFVYHHKVRPDLRLRIGRHCGTMEMSL